MTHRPTPNTAFLQARKSDTDSWGTLQRFRDLDRNKRFEKAHIALNHWLDNWQEAPAHAFRIVHGYEP